MENEPFFNQSQKAFAPMVVVAIIGVLVGALIGGVIGFNINKTTDTTLVSPTQSNSGTNSADYQAGFEAARAKMVEKGIIPDMANNQNSKTLSIVGTVKKISGNTLMVEFPSMDVFGDPAIRTVIVTADTDLYKMVSKEQAVIEAEMNEFIAKINAQNGDGTETETTIEPPQSFNREKITLQSIKEGEMISVSAASAIPLSGDITAKTIETSPTPPFEDNFKEIPVSVSGE